MTKPVFIAAAEARRVRAIGSDHFITMPRAKLQTGVSLFEDVREPGDGPPLHVHHNEDEISRVIEGRFRLRLGEDTIDAAPGDTLFMPRDVPHCFINSGDGTGRLLFILQPGGFEQFFLDVEAEDLQVPADIERITAIAARYKLEILGPNPLMAR